MIINTYKIGSMCAYYRKKVLNISQERVAEDLFINRSYVSNFENGKNNSYEILAWYISHGLLETFSLVELGLYNAC